MKVKSDLTIIPGIGRSIAKNLQDIGINKMEDLKGKDPEKLYLQSNKFVGVKQDRCLLYTFRCAVYFANNKKHEKELLKWWNWQDKKFSKFRDVKNT